MGIVPRRITDGMPRSTPGVVQQNRNGVRSITQRFQNTNPTTPNGQSSVPNGPAPIAGSDTPGYNTTGTWDVLKGGGNLSTYDKFLLGYESDQIDQLLAGMGGAAQGGMAAGSQGAQAFQQLGLSAAEINNLINQRQQLRDGTSSLWFGNGALQVGAGLPDNTGAWSKVSGSGASQWGDPKQGAYMPWGGNAQGDESMLTDPVKFGEAQKRAGSAVGKLAVKMGSYGKGKIPKKPFQAGQMTGKLW